MYKTLLTGLLLVILYGAANAEDRNIRTFARPAWTGSTTTLIHIEKVELTDTATVISFYGKNAPGCRMTIAPGAYLIGDNGKEYKALRGEGITLGTYYTTPQNGESRFKVLFEPLPRKTRFFDFIEGQTRGSFQIYGIHEEGKAPKTRKQHETFMMTPELEREFFKADTACVKGRIEGYSRSLGFSTLLFSQRNVLTGEMKPLTVEIQEDGTFEIRFLALHPTEGYAFMQGKDFHNSFLFYAVPGQTSELVVKTKGAVVYTSTPSGTFGRQQSLAHNYSEACAYPYSEYAADAASYGFKDFIANTMQKMQTRLHLLDYLAWRFGYTPWERHLAENQIRMTHATRIFYYTSDKQFAITEGMTQEEYDTMMEPIRDLSSYRFMREMPCNDASCLANHDFDSFMNSYEFSQVIRGGAPDAVDFYTEHVAQYDAAMMVGDTTVLETTEPSFMGRLAILHELASDLESYYNTYPETCDSIYENRLTYLNRDVLRTQAARLREKARRHSTLTYALPDTKGGRLLRRLTEKFKGKYLMIDFWGMSCAPCRAGIEHSQKVRETLRNHPDLDFLFISAEGDGPEADYRKYVNEHLDGEDVVQVSRDDFNLLMELFNFLGIPHYETLDRKGNVVRNGLHYTTEQYLLQQLDELKSQLEN